MVPTEPFNDENIYTHIQVHKHTHTHTLSLILPWEDQCEWHRMTRLRGPDCAVMFNLINTHTHTHTHTHTLHRGLGYKSHRVFLFCPDFRVWPTHSSPGNCSSKNSSSQQQAVRCVAATPWPAGAFLRDGMFWNERGEGLTRPQAGPYGYTVAMRTAMGTNLADPGSFSSRFCAFQRTHRVQTLFGYFDSY